MKFSTKISPLLNYDFLHIKNLIYNLLILHGGILILIPVLFCQHFCLHYRVRHVLSKSSMSSTSTSLYKEPI